VPSSPSHNSFNGTGCGRLDALGASGDWNLAAALFRSTRTQVWLSQGLTAKSDLWHWNQNAQKKQNFTKYVHFQMNEKWPKNAVFHYLSSGASIDLALPRSNLEPGSLSVHLLPAWGNKKDQVGLTSTARLISIIAGCWSVAKTVLWTYPAQAPLQCVWIQTLCSSFAAKIAK
jgi:hypothetical protein